jgi:hypothetical protein
LKICWVCSKVENRDQRGWSQIPPFAKLKRAKMANIHQKKPEDTIVVWKLKNV